MNISFSILLPPFPVQPRTFQDAVQLHSKSFYLAIDTQPIQQWRHHRAQSKQLQQWRCCQQRTRRWPQQFDRRCGK